MRKKLLIFLFVFTIILTFFWIYKNTPDYQTVFLSFDVEPIDGPDAPLVIAKILERNNIPATFFITGEYADTYPETVKKLAKFDIGCHSYSHPNMAKLTKEQQREEITRSRATLENLTGRKITGYRAPYNLLNKDTFAVLAEEGFEYDASIISGWRIFYAVPPTDIKEIPISSYQGMPMEDVSWMYFTHGLGTKPFFNIIRQSRGVNSYDFHPHEIIKEKEEFEKVILYLKIRNATFIIHS
jgi:peptidoglycan/xylan/chitin deacetylase (PgdA/CDA1 family)